MDPSTGIFAEREGMNLEQALLEDRSKEQKDRIVQYIGNDQKKFTALMKLFFEGEYRLTQLAAWPMSYCIQKHPGLIKPHFKKLVATLKKPGAHEAVIRNIVRVLQDIAIPEQYHGEVMNACFDFIASNDVPVAIKAFSLTILQNLSKVYPDIKQELKLVIEERWDHETAAFRSRARKVLKDI